MVTETQEKELTSVWKGSQLTAGSIAQQIAQRWGTEASKEYQPDTNCFTYNGWRQRGYQVKRGEKALKSFTFVSEKTKEKDDAGNEKIKFHSYPKSVSLFFIKQVDKKN